jgi:Tfp pilus assembly protein PilO
MNKIPKEKRNQLILASLIVAAIAAGLYFTLIRFQQNKLLWWQAQRDTVDTKMADIRDTIKHAQQIEVDLLAVSNKLATQEEDMPSGDLYASMVNMLRKFNLGRDVDIPQFSCPGTATEMTMLPKFPYKQVVMTIAGTAYYQDLGKFVADFENQFPSSRILNLDVTPAITKGPGEEKVSFRMDIASLVKGGAGAPEVKGKL